LKSNVFIHFNKLLSVIKSSPSLSINSSEGMVMKFSRRRGLEELEQLEL
ncbi:uncharacterized, partial [Tachysurus ichikawai]